MIHGVPRGFFFQNGSVKVSKFCLPGKNDALVGDGRVQTPSKIQTTGPRRLKYGLNRSQINTVDDP